MLGKKMRNASPGFWILRQGRKDAISVFVGRRPSPINNIGISDTADKATVTPSVVA